MQVFACKLASKPRKLLAVKNPLTPHIPLSLSPLTLVIPSRVEQDMMAIFPRDSWAKLHLQFIYFGREHCQVTPASISPGIIHNSILLLCWMRGLNIIVASFLWAH